MTIRVEIDRRGIAEVLHFSTNRGILGTIASGSLLSRFMLPKEDYLADLLHVNSQQRPEASEFFDKSKNWLNYVNLSISEINRRFFEVSQRWHGRNEQLWWGILGFDADILTHHGAVFATTNNSYECCLRGEDLEGLAALFEPVISRKPGWNAYRLQRSSELTTCEQAELLYPERVGIEHLRSIYVQDASSHDAARGWLLEYGLHNVKVLISPAKFLGKPN